MHEKILCQGICKANIKGVSQLVWELLSIFETKTHILSAYLDSQTLDVTCKNGQCCCRPNTFQIYVSKGHFLLLLCVCVRERERERERQREGGEQ